VKHQVGYVAYRIASGLFGALPEPAVRVLGEFAGRIWYLLGSDRRTLVARHMRRVAGPDASDDEIDQMTRRAFRSYGRYWAETFWIRPRRKQEVVESATVEGEELFKESVASGRGVILALPHMGNWEIAGAKAEDMGGPVLAAAEALSNPKIVEWFVEARAGMGIEVVLAGKGHRATAALARRLRAGGVIALLADRDISGRGIEVELFGERTTVPPGPAALALRTGAYVLPVGSYFEEGRGHRYVVGERIELVDGDDDADAVAAGAQHIASVLEDMIRHRPWDWHLFVPNWPSDREDTA
jgi:KDO2-lipid IV(A) lauroyltransferase